MPKTPIDYSRTVIYKIQHIEDDTLLYIGSTTDFTKRKSQHKISFLNPKSKEYNNKKYQVIRDNGGWDMFSMIEIEKYPCRDKREAEKREDELMRTMKANMNSYRAHCGFDTIQQYQQQYRNNNKETIQQHKKQYRNDNKETINEKMKRYYNDNKETIQAKASERITCECGNIIRRDSINRHRKSKKHIDLMSNK